MIINLVFISTWIFLLVWAIRTMSRGWQAASQIGGRTFVEENKRYVTRPIHPEMAEVKTGEELLVVNFKKEPEDPLYKSMQDRIEELKNEDDDDAGDVVVRV